MDDNPVRRRLLPGERLLWLGAPGRGVLFRSHDLFGIPFSLLWCAFAVFWTQGASRTSWSMGLFGLPFVAIGLFMLFGRFALDIWLRRRTVYAVTDRRVLIQRDGPFGAFVSLDLASVSEMTLLDEGGRRETLRFGPESSPKREGGNRLVVPALDEVPQFIAIEGAGDVLRVVVEAVDAARVRGRR